MSKKRDRKAKSKSKSEAIPVIAFDYTAYRLPAEMRKASIREPRRAAFRTSSFPICARYIALTRLRERVQGRVFSRRRFVNDAYFSAGHAAHATTQFWMGRIGALYGVWRCPRFFSKAKGRNTEIRKYCGYEEEGWGNRACPRCMKRDRTESWLEYQEYALHKNSDSGLNSAHTDGLTYVNPTGETHLPLTKDVLPNTIFEAKTTSEAHYNEVRKQLREGITPDTKSFSHLEQASGYALLVEQQFRDRKGWGKAWEGIRWLMYVYINRNHPWQFVAFLKPRLDYDVIRRNAKKYRKGDRWVDRVKSKKLTSSSLPKGKCLTVEDASGFEWRGMTWMECPEKDACFGVEGDGGIEGGMTPAWIDRYLVQIREPDKKRRE